MNPNKQSPIPRFSAGLLAFGLMPTDCAYPAYRKTFLDAGAEFFFEKSTEFDRVSEAVGQLGLQT